MLCVCKFGGSSVATEKGLEKIKEAVNSSPARKVIVVSAIGKRFAGDIKVTDLLIKLAEKPSDEKLKKQILSRFYNLKKRLRVDIDIRAEFNRLPQDKDYVVSRGEYVTAKIVAEFLDYDFIDACKVLYFKKGKLDVYKSRRALSKINLKKGVVIPGFYVCEKGKIKLLERGGSDLSGAYLCRLLKADYYENYTDVSGVMCVSPDILPDNVTIKNMSYQDLKRLSELNLKILQKHVYKSVIGTKTQIVVRNTFDFNSARTVIKNVYITKTPKVFGIGLKDDKIVIIGRKLNGKQIKSAIKGALYNLRYTMKISYYKAIIDIDSDKTVVIKMLFLALKKYV